MICNVTSGPILRLSSAFIRLISTISMYYCNPKTDSMHNRKCVMLDKQQFYYPQMSEFSSKLNALSQIKYKCAVNFSAKLERINN